MQNISFDEGLIELSINGDSSRIIKFNPNSKEFREGYMKSLSVIGELARKNNAMEKEINESECGDEEKKKKISDFVSDSEKQVTSAIESILGEGSVDVIMNGNSVFSVTLASGQFVIVNFLEALKGYFDKSFKNVVEKHTGGYKNENSKPYGHRNNRRKRR